MKFKLSLIILCFAFALPSFADTEMEFLDGEVFATNRWQGNFSVVLTGKAAEGMYNFIWTKGAQHVLDIVPPKLVRSKNIECTHNETRESVYECAFFLSVSEDNEVIVKPGA